MGAEDFFSWSFHAQTSAVGESTSPFMPLAWLYEKSCHWTETVQPLANTMWKPRLLSDILNMIEYTASAGKSK